MVRLRESPFSQDGLRCDTWPHAVEFPYLWRLRATSQCARQSSRTSIATSRRCEPAWHTPAPRARRTSPSSATSWAITPTRLPASTSFKPEAGVAIPLPARWQWLAIAGSVGQPRDGNAAAAYTLFEHGSRSLRFFRVPYDHQTAARKVLAAGLPERLAWRLRHGY